MSERQRRQHTIFTTVRSEGSILPVDLLQRVATANSSLAGLAPDSYYLLKTEKLNEAINRSWNRLLSAWGAFKSAQDKLPEKDAGTTLTRERWLLPLFYELGYGRLLTAKALEVGDRSYAISHGWQNTPMHLVSFRVDLDHYSRSSAGLARSSPHSLVQELLNHSESHLWGMLSNGLRLRVLRNNVSLTRQAFVEFDLEAMMNAEVYADFALLWLLCHASRVEGERPAECWLEKWSRTAHEQGTRALDQLRNGVEKAITSLGAGFLAHPANTALREQLRTGELSTQDYYRQLLRLVYRLIVLFVAEDRDILFHPEASELARERYTRYYSTARLRHLAEQRVGTRHADLYAGLQLVMEKLGHDTGCPELGLPALNSFLFSQEAIAALLGCQIANHDLLDATRSLAFTLDRSTRRSIDYKNLGSEELGSVYESLLELHPVLSVDAATFELTTAGGHERKTTGSYYTPTSLITCLLDSALDPVLDEAERQPDAETAMLNLKICDPACGSGHFLIAAAHRVARRLAAIRTGVEEPAPEARRKALRDVIGRCIYGVDINPMSVELCKVSLWMEAIEPGKPLSFLEQHIQCGNSLLGATPALLAKGIPDSAFEPIEGDDKKICSEYKKKNRYQREGNRTLFDEELQPWNRLGDLATGMMQLDEMADDTVEEIHRKQDYYAQLVRSSGYEFGRLWADAWCAAFVWKKTSEFAYPITEEVFRKIEENPYNLAPWMREEIKRLAAQYQFFHWHIAFPDVFRVPTKGEEPENEQAGWSGGFDVVLGNPPWEHAELKEQEWFATRDHDIAEAVGAERKLKITSLATKNPTLHNAFLQALRDENGQSHFIRNTGFYPLCGRGRINTYAIFAEMDRLIVGANGRIGCIVPSGIATDDTTKYFFQDLMEARAIVNLFAFENEAKLFPGIDHRVKFALLTMAGTGITVNRADFAFGLYTTDDLQEEKRHFSLTATDISLLNPNTRTCPIFRSKRDSELTKAIYQRVPILIKENSPQGNTWDITIRQGLFNMTSDSHLFCSCQQLENNGWVLEGNVFHRDHKQSYLPLYEAKMIWHFNHRFGTYEGATVEELARGKLPELSSEQLENPDYYPVPNRWIATAEVVEVCSFTPNWFLCLRGITSANLLRTFVGTIVPCAAVGNSMPIIWSSQASAIDFLCFQANLSSFVEDYIVRQSVGGSNFNLYIIKQIPFLSPQNYAEQCPWFNTNSLRAWLFPRSLELTYTAWDLEPFAKDCGYDGSPFRWDEERRFLLRCELDAAYFHLYGIERDDVDYIMETFPIVKRKDEKQYGEYRTKRVILEIYDEMKRAMESGEAYRTRLVPGPADPLVAHGPRESVDVAL